MAAAVGRLMGVQGNSFLRNGGKKNSAGRRNGTVMASVAFPGMKEEYETLRLSPEASQKDVKSAFRRLALQYHPDVCKGDNCGVQFQKINQAYQVAEIVIRTMLGWTIRNYALKFNCEAVEWIADAQILLQESSELSNARKVEKGNSGVELAYSQM